MADTTLESRVAELEAQIADYDRVLYGNPRTGEMGLVKAHFELKQQQQADRNERDQQKAMLKGALIFGGIGSFSGLTGVLTVLTQLIGGGGKP